MCATTNLTQRQRMQIKTHHTWDTTSHALRKANKEKTDNNEYSWNCKEIRNFIHCCWKYQMVQPLWKTVWWFLTKLNMILLSIQFSCSVVSNSLQPHGLQHSRLPCPSPTPEAYSNLCPFSRWCHPTISSSVISVSSYLQSFPASGSFPISQFFHLVAKALELQL